MPIRARSPARFIPASPPAAAPLAHAHSERISRGRKRVSFRQRSPCLPATDMYRPRLCRRADLAFTPARCPRGPPRVHAHTSRRRCSANRHRGFSSSSPQADPPATLADPRRPPSARSLTSYVSRSRRETSDTRLPYSGRPLERRSPTLWKTRGRPAAWLPGEEESARRAVLEPARIRRGRPGYRVPLPRIRGSLLGVFIFSGVGSPRQCLAGSFFAGNTPDRGISGRTGVQR